MRFIDLESGDNPIGGCRSGSVAIVSPDIAITLCYIDPDGVVVPYAEGAIAAGTDAVFDVGVGTAIAIKASGSGKVGLAEL